MLTQWAFLEKIPVEAIVDIFKVDPHQIYRDPLEFSIFLHQPPWKSTFFPRLLDEPPGIVATSTLHHGTFH